MADKSNLAQHLTGDTVALVLEKTPEGVEFDIVPADANHTWEIGEALRHVMIGLSDFLHETES